MWSSSIFWIYWETLKWSELRSETMKAWCHQPRTINILLISTHRVLYPGHWLKMDQLWMHQKQMVQMHPVYFSFWEGDLDDLYDRLKYYYQCWQMVSLSGIYTCCSQISNCLYQLRIRIWRIKRGVCMKLLQCHGWCIAIIILVQCHTSSRKVNSEYIVWILSSF